MIKKALFSISLVIFFFLMTNPLFAEDGGSWTDKFEAGYKKGFYIKSRDGKFKLSIGSYTQMHYEFERFENTSKDDENTFRVRRARIFFDGNVFSERLKYKFQIELTSPSLLDAYFDIAAYGDLLNIRVGQYTIPMGRQQMVSSSRQQFNDRSLASKEFVPAVEVDADGDGVAEKTRKDGRDIGIMAHGQAFDGKLEYAVAAMNGSGTNTTNVNNEFLYAGRAVYNIMGDYGYAEGDVDYSDDPSLFVGTSGNYNVTEVSQSKILSGGFESGLKWKGLSLQSEFMVRNAKAPGASSIRDYGYYAQAGYFLVPKKFEIAARASQLFKEGPRNDKGEFMLGLNYFVYKHNVKLQSDYSWLPTNTKAGVENDHRIRLRLQTRF